MSEEPGIFTISLDFELHWGGFEKWPLHTENTNRFFRPSTIGPDYRRYFLNTRLIIPEMLETLAGHGAHVTWATVGLLFHQSRKELLENIPSQLPSFQQEHLSAFNYINTTGIGEDETTDPFHFAPSLIRLIKKTPGMEIGSHTYAHYYACEQGQTAAQFRADLVAAKNVAELNDIQLSSLVLPRNQVNPDYLEICYQEGFKAVRVNPTDWYWEIPPNEPVSLWKRLNRTADAYIPIGQRKSYPLSSIQNNPGMPKLIPASRFLRPYKKWYGPANEIRLNRILQEMESAARNQEVYHLWWHPHNFGFFPRQSMEGLQRILSHFIKLNDKYGMVSMNMAELTTALENNH
jgi:peptidoglycan/xylan/chitin deacetylase (PgdA/CDA1 family)